MRPYLIMLLPPLFWSGNYVVGRLVASDMGAITLSFWRWQLALLILLPFIVRPIVNQWQIIRANFLQISLLSALSVTGFNTLVYIGLRDTTATNATLMNSFIPIFILLITGMVFKEAISRKQIIGVAVSLLGILVILTRLDPQVIISFSVNNGDLWVLAATFVWAAYSVLLKQLRPNELDGMAFLGCTVVIGVVILLPLFLLNPYQEPSLVWDRNNILALFYVAIFPSVIAYLSWNYGMKKIGAALGGQFIHFMPIFGAIMAVVFLGESIQLYHLFGGLGVGVGLWLSMQK